ncbi:MAG: type II secretion system F family protein [Alphaproteobacteria bacterium]|nr:type II secretion system F family protein [Alphaproteobacteria bacterium]
MNPLALLPPGVGAEDAIILFAALSAFLVVLAVWRTLLARDPMTSRLKQIERRRLGLRDEMLSTRRRAGDLNPAHVDFMRQVVDRLNLMRGNVTEKATLRLEQAGFRSRDALVAYVFMKLVMPLVAGAGAVLLLYGLNIYDLTPLMRLAIALGVVVLVSYAPDIYLRNTTAKRKVKLQRALPDGLDLLVICAEAGLSLDAALQRVSREIGNAYPDLADEVALTSVELGFLPDRSKALENLTRRTDLASIRGLVNTLMQTEKYGTPLANSLRVLAAEYRNERMMKAEEKAAKLPATMTIPMVLFILPALFVVILGPAIIRMIDSFAAMK